MVKKRGRWHLIVLAIILCGVFLVRLDLSTSVDALSYDSYLTVREVEHIQETGKPLSTDALSLTGNTRVGSALYAYILAVIVPLSPLMYKIIPNLLMILLLIPVYYLTFSFTKSRAASFLSVVLAATAPSVFVSNLNTPTATPLSIGLFLTIVLLLQQPGKYLYWIVGMTLFLTFLSPIVFVLVLALLMIIILLRLEGFGVDKRINELFFFTLILAVWFHVLVYKRALFADGIRVLWQNLPAKYAALQFGTVTFIDLLYGLGVITFLFGVLGAYHTLFETRAKTSYSVIGAGFAVLSLLLLRVIEIQLGLVLLSLLLAVMAGYGLLVVVRYFERTKAPWMVYGVIILTIGLFFFTAIVPSLSGAKQAMQNSPSDADVVAFQEIKTHVPAGAVFLTTVREGAAVQYFSGHKTVTDDDFLLLDNGDELVRDIDGVYTTRFSITIVGKAEKLGFSHILFTNDAARQYERDKLQVEESRCLSYRELSPGTGVYRILCRGDRV